MTGWLEYFVDGLSTKLLEVRRRSEAVIQRDVLAKRHGLSDRRAKAIEFILQHGSMTIRDLEGLFPDVNRRTLQRDIKGLLDAGLVLSEGSTNQLTYRLKDKSN